MSGPIVIDRGWGNFECNMRRLNGAYTKVGFPTREPRKDKPGEGTGRSGGSVVNLSDNVTIAAVNEFGAPARGIPERSFMRTSFDEGQKALNAFKLRIHTRLTMGLITPDQALSAIGEFHAAQVKKKIRDLKTPPNAPATIKKKRKGKPGPINPLIDTAQMVQAVTHVEHGV